MKTLENLFMDGLADIYDAEQRLVRALPKMAKAATSPALRSAILSHLKQTEGHVKKLEQVFKICGEKPKGKKCEATVGLLEEADEIANDFKGSPAINAALISAAQKVEHYEIASYGCLREWAGLLGKDTATGLLSAILDEEKKANESLEELARSGANQDALGEGDDSETEAPAAARSKPARRLGRPVTAARSRTFAAAR